MSVRSRMAVIAAVNCISMPLKKLFHGRCFTFTLPELVSPGATLQIDKGGQLKLGRKCYIKSGTFFAVLPGAEAILGENVSINRDCKFVVRRRISIGKGTTIGPNCLFYDHDHDSHVRGEYVSKSISIGEHTWIGGGCIILKGVTIGDHCTIAAGTVVTKDVPSNTMVYQKRNTVMKAIMDN